VRKKDKQYAVELRVNARHPKWTADSQAPPLPLLGLAIAQHSFPRLFINWLQSTSVIPLLDSMPRAALRMDLDDGGGANCGGGRTGDEDLSRSLVSLSFVEAPDAQF